MGASHVIFKDVTHIDSFLILVTVGRSEKHKLINDNDWY